MDNKTKIPIRAMIYHIADGKTAIKAFANVSIGDFMYINSFSIAVSSYGDELVVYPPTTKCINKKYKKIVEFPNHNNSKLLDTITKVCKLAYAKYEDDGELNRFGDPFYIKVEDLIDFDKTMA